MSSFQHYGFHANGELGFAGTSKIKAANKRAAAKIARDWRKWAQRYVAENAGDYPLAAAVRSLPVNPIVKIQLHPVGAPENCATFEV